MDDALKLATPLTNGVINEMLRQFAPLSYISQGSVATHLRCGWIFSDDIIANFLLILTFKQFRNRLIVDKVKAYKNCANFLGHPVHLPLAVDRAVAPPIHVIIYHSRPSRLLSETGTTPPF